MTSRNILRTTLIVIFIILCVVIYKYFPTMISTDNGRTDNEQHTQQSNSDYSQNNPSKNANYSRANTDITDNPQYITDATERAKTQVKLLDNNTIQMRTTLGYYKKSLSDEWVVVDCQNRKILKCPHALNETQTTPLVYEEGTSHFLYGKCKDVTVDTRSFCGF